MFCTSSDPSFIRGLRGENSIDIDEKTYFPTKVKSQHIFHWLCHSILPIQNGLGVEINVRLHVPSLLGNVLWLMNINSESLEVHFWLNVTVRNAQPQMTFVETWQIKATFMFIVPRCFYVCRSFVVRCVKVSAYCCIPVIIQLQTEVFIAVPDA